MFTQLAHNLNQLSTIFESEINDESKNNNESKQLSTDDSKINDESKQLSTDELFNQRFDKIMKILGDPKSYKSYKPTPNIQLEPITEPSDDIDMENVKDIFLKRVSEVGGEVTIIQVVKSLINSLLTSFNVVLSDVQFQQLETSLIILFEKMLSVPKNCVHFQSFDYEMTEAELEKIGVTDSTPYKLMIILTLPLLLQTDLCLCGRLKSDHQTCTKYQPSNLAEYSSDCLTCGLSQYTHTICDQYVITSENANKKQCETCGRDHLSHINQLEEKGIYHCDQFVDSGHDYCQTCQYQKITHVQTPFYYSLNKNCASDLMFELTMCGFLCDQLSDPFQKIISMTQLQNISKLMINRNNI